MLDAFIIKRIQEEKEKEKSTYERPSLEVDPPKQAPLPPMTPQTESNRGVVIIDFSV